ncbi:hypothetical protein VTK26DRAFT_6078 [Humicola hyalothermophila]
MATPAATSGLCPDWVLASGSNVHVARNRAWFFHVYVVPDLRDLTYHVEPAGSSRHWRRSPPSQTVPEALWPRSSRHASSTERPPRAYLRALDTAAKTRQLPHRMADGSDTLSIAASGFLSSVGLLSALLLALPCWSQGTSYVINAYWPDSEHQRWASALAGRLGLDHSTNREVSDGGKGKDKAEAAPSAPYTEEEKGWLKREWGGKFKFLTAHGLSIYKDKDRNEGRRMARAVIKVDEDGDTRIYSGDRRRLRIPHWTVEPASWLV